MRPKTRPLAFVLALFALASLASSQEPRFERLHESVDTSSREVNGAVNGYRRFVSPLKHGITLTRKLAQP